MFKKTIQCPVQGRDRPEPLEVEPIEYMGYLIYPEPMAEVLGHYRLAGRITRGDRRAITDPSLFIRSDLCQPGGCRASWCKKAHTFIDRDGGAV